VTTHRPVLYADFHNADARGRLRLNCVGTVHDLARQGIILREGLRLRLRDEELEVDGEVRFAPEENGWVAVIDWQAVQPHGDPASS
jgi:hypothetical protein